MEGLSPAGLIESHPLEAERFLWLTTGKVRKIQAPEGPAALLLALKMEKRWEQLSKENITCSIKMKKFELTSNF